MEIHKNTNKQLNDLLNEARHEKPVMNLKEVEQIIADGKYTPAAGRKGFHIGMNNMIVVCGIVVSSFLAYMALKVDNGEAVVNASQATELNNGSPNSTSGQLASVATPVESKAESNNAVTVPAVQHNASQVKVADRTQPKQNPATLLASSDKNLVATSSEPAERIVAPVAAKMPSGEYVITFNYDGQDIRMKLVGDEVSEFTVDGRAVPADQYGDYDDILAEGKNYLIGNTHTDEASSSLNLIKYFDGQLRGDGVLDKEVQYKFELSSTQLIVNGEVQSNALFKKYKALYQDKTGKNITDGSVYKFERGAKSE